MRQIGLGGLDAVDMRRLIELLDGDGGVKITQATFIRRAGAA